jgi:hypothetical protein
MTPFLAVVLMFVLAVAAIAANMVWERDSYVRRGETQRDFRARTRQRPPYFRRGETVEILVDDRGSLLSPKQVWAPGRVVRRLRKNEDLPFETSGWGPVASWYLVRFDADGSLARTSAAIET